MMTKPLENQNQKHVSNNKGPVTTNSLKVFRSNSVFKQLNSEGELSSAPQDEKLEPRGAKRARSQSLTEQESASKGANSVTEESRLQSILAISVVSTKNASLQSQSRFDYDGATIR
jgi:hypothetical protein